MRSKVAARILANTPPEMEVFANLYGDMVIRIYELMKEKGLSQKDVAEKMGKTPAEVSRWLKGEHNLTLRSLAKLQVVLGSPIIYVPKRKVFTSSVETSLSMTVYKNDVSKVRKPKFSRAKKNRSTKLRSVA